MISSSKLSLLLRRFAMITAFTVAIFAVLSLLSFPTITQSASIAASSREPSATAISSDEPPAIATSSDEPPAIATSSDEPPATSSDEPPAIATSSDEPPATSSDEQPAIATSSDKPPVFQSSTEYPNCCPYGWHLLPVPQNSRCIKVFPNRRTWAVAAGMCVAENGRLASVHSDFENQFIYNEIRRVISDGGEIYGINDGVWLGGKTNSPIAGDTSAWFWVDGTDFPWYMRWSGGQPNYEVYNEQCLGMYTQASLATYWNDFPSTYTLPFVCQHAISEINCNRLV